MQNDDAPNAAGYSATFKELQFIYLIAYGLASAGNNIQGSYFYALLASYKLERSVIELLYLCTHVSTFFLGTVASSLSDKFGRRLACILSSVFYIIHSISLNADLLSVLLVGSVARGIAHSFYNTNFEAWLIQAHHSNGLSTASLKQLLHNAFLLSALLAVIVGVVAQFSTKFLGYIAPFNIAIVAYILMIAFVLWRWEENYGDKEAKPATSFIAALEVLHEDLRVILLGMVTALFDATIYIFVIEWTPALQQADRWVIYEPLPLGLIFSCYMTFGLFGALMFKPLCDRFQPQSYLLAVILVAAVAMAVPVLAPDIQPVLLVSFCMFKFCVGLYMPSISLLRSQYLPDKVRATLMNYFRIPRFLFMFAIIVCHFSIPGMFVSCVGMLLCAASCLVMLGSMNRPEDEIRMNESTILLSPAANVQSKESPSNDVSRSESSIAMSSR